MGLNDVKAVFKYRVTSTDKNYTVEADRVEILEEMIVFWLKGHVSGIVSTFDDILEEKSE